MNLEAPSIEATEHHRHKVFQDRCRKFYGLALMLGAIPLREITEATGRASSLKPGTARMSPAHLVGVAEELMTVVTRYHQAGRITSDQHMRMVDQICGLILSYSHIEQPNRRMA